MSRFLFYDGEDLSVVDRLRRTSASLWGPVREVSRDSFWIFVPKADCEQSFCESADVLGAVSGYVRREDPEASAGGAAHCDADHNRRFLQEIVREQGWPLGDRWTGSFAAVAYSRRRREVVLCNDPIGYFPVYFSASATATLGGTSLIALSRCLRCGIDPVGVLERITPPYCHYGRRTLLKPVSRLLPGEWMKISRLDLRSTSRFDNSLCQGVLDGDVHGVARTVWNCLRREILLVADSGERLGLAMSGGWDSRLVLRAVAEKGEAIHCYTYGDPDLYESYVARRCADAIGARHSCFPLTDRYFPARPDLEALVRQSESANYMEWYGLLTEVKAGPENKQLLLLGDLCEGIDGRYIEEFASRKARKRAFVEGLLGRAERIADGTETAFEQWKEDKKHGLLEGIQSHVDRLAPALAERCREEVVGREVGADLELSFARVRDNLPAFAPMFDELFAWFHRVRFLLASQIPLLSCGFRPVSAGMSVRFLRLISQVHPRLRLRRRLMDAIARLPEFDALAPIPSAQIPWLSGRAPAPLRELLWGMRSALDQLLTRAVLRTKNAEKRQRVLRSLDYVKEYRRLDVDGKVNDWFSGRWLRPEGYLRVLRDRANLVAWPLINVDIVAPANVSILLDLCQTEEGVG